jgi:hypothetical protein
VSETDPFTDAAFTTRLQKLLSMLGSEQPGEADAARRKIGEHLAHYRLSYTDLANHLGDRGALAGAAFTRGASFTQGARELSLERQLAIAREAKEAAQQEAEAALHRVRVLEIELQQATFEIGRTLNGQGRVRAAAALACMVAVGCLIFVVLPREPLHNARPGPVPHAENVIVQPNVTQADPTDHVAPGEVLGRAAVQDLAIRLNPNDEATIRAFLNYGERVVIERQEHVGQQTWLLVRSATGEGWVRAGDVLR